MRYPNTRYGKLSEFQHYAMGVPLVDLARQLRRDERTVRDWLSGRASVPWWVPELMRLQRLEKMHVAAQMGFARAYRSLGLVSGEVLELRRHPKKKEPQLTELRLADFDSPKVAEA